MIFSTRSSTGAVIFGTKSSAFRFSFTCSTRDAPVMTEDTCGLRAHHAMASWESVQPSSCAMASSAPTAAFFAGSVSPSTRKDMRGIAARLSLGMPLRYLPVSSPEASGLQVVRPIPMSL